QREHSEREQRGFAAIRTCAQAPAFSTLDRKTIVGVFEILGTFGRGEHAFGLHEVEREVLRELCLPPIGAPCLTVVMIPGHEQKRDSIRKRAKILPEKYPFFGAVVVGQIAKSQSCDDVASARLLLDKVRLAPEVPGATCNVVLRIRQHRERETRWVDSL